MPRYELRFKRSVEKDLRRLPGTVLSRILARIEKLGSDPFPRQARMLVGAERLFRIRVGDYRVVYEVDTAASTVTVLYVRHRRQAYDR